MNKSYLFAGILTLLTGGWIASGFLGGPTIAAAEASDANAPAPQQDEQKKELLKVQVLGLKAEETLNEISLLGKTEASRKVTLKSQITGNIHEIFVQKGQKVQKGDLIAKISIDDRLTSVQRAKSFLQQKEIELNAARALSQKGFNSEIRYAEAKAQRDEAKFALETAELQLSYTEIKAPFDGVLETNFVEIGDFVDLGNDLFSVIDLNPIKISGQISEKNLLELTPGAAAKVELLDGRYLDGTVTYISPSADDITRTFKVEITLENPSHLIVEGLTTRLHIPTSTEKGYFVTPSLLTLDDVGTIGIKTIDENHIVHFSPIEIMRSEKTGVWITGLPEQVNIIAVGQEYVTEGQKVAPTFINQTKTEDK